MTAPSIDAVSKLVEELRRWAQFESARSAGVLTRAADALEAQARELAEARERADRYQRIADDHREFISELKPALATAQTRIAALEDAVRVKDEANAALQSAVLVFAAEFSTADMPPDIKTIVNDCRAWAKGMEKHNG